MTWNRRKTRTAAACCGGMLVATLALAERGPRLSGEGIGRAPAATTPIAAAEGGVAEAFGDGTPVPDGSFENGPPPASDWTETNNSVECSTGIGSWAVSWGGVPTPAGLNDFWAGGFCDGESEQVAIENSVHQQVEVPEGTPLLVFWYAALRVDGDQSAGADVGYLDVDGAEQWSVDVSTSAANTDAGGATVCFVPVSLDLSAFAGQTVELRVGIDTDLSNGVGNVRFDGFHFADLVFADGFECGSAAWVVGP